MKPVANRKVESTKYVLAFFITLIIFIIGIYVGDSLNQNKVDELKELNEDIRMTTLAMQTQYDLVAEDPCKVMNDSVLLKELIDLSLKVEYMENQLGQTHPEVKKIKNYYSTLLIKNWLYTRNIQEQCKESDIQYILYFYSTKEECPYCESQGYILTNLRKDNPNVRIYPFDYNLDNPALRTLKAMFIEEEDNFPILVIDGAQTQYGFMNRAKIETELDSRLLEAQTKKAQESE